MTRSIKGFKGGGKGGGGGSTRAPVESPDSLRSRQFARLIDLVGEGEIEGFGTGDLRSVYFDKTPLLNDNGSYNFSGVSVTLRNGTQDQSHISGFASVESEQVVNVQVLESTPIVRSVTDDEVDAVRITISIPQLSRVDTQTGDTEPTNVRLRIRVQADGGSYVTVKEDTISGKATTKYQRSYLIPLTGDAPWNIQVERMSDDSTSQTLQNATYWESYTVIKNAKLRYPNSAVVATVIDAQQFNQIPVRGYDMKMLRTQIPSNATVRTDGSLEYSGTWDGTFQIAWHSNPAWVFWDMLTADRYGLGQFVSAEQVDKWALYQIGQYCDELVDDGFGGHEPRFSCNIYIQEQREAFQVIQDLASVFRGLVYWASSQIAAVQDAPADSTALFTNANVIDGVFTYAGSSLKTRHTVALVSWNDPDDFYALKPEYVEDKAGIERYGLISTEIIAVGCTSRGQAHRVGKWLLYSEGNETETCTFKGGLDSALVRPGAIIEVQDANRAGVRRGGRVRSAAGLAITVDQAFTPSPGVQYEFSVMMADGTVATSPVAGIAGNVITLSVALPGVPQVNAIWMASSDTLQSQKFRVISVIDAGDGQIEVTGLRHNEDKFAYVERDIILTSNPISVLNDPPDAPQSVSISEALYQSGSSVKNVVTVSWGQVERADTYSLSYRVNGGNPIVVDGIRSQLWEIRDAPTGTYEATVSAVSINRKRSQPGIATQVIYGKTAPPSNVPNFSLAGITNAVAQLVWGQAPDLDVVIGGYVRIRHTPDIVSPDWSSAVDIGPALPGNATTASVPHIDGTYLAKFVDSSGNSSVEAVSVSTRTASLVNMNVVETIEESLAFAGTHDGTAYPGALDTLSLGYAGYVDDIPMIDDLISWDTYGGVNSTGTYRFADTLDLGAVYTCRLTAMIAVTGLDELSTIDERLGDLDSWAAFDGDVVDDVNATLYVRTCEVDPATLTDDDPEWSDWFPFFIGQYDARGYQFKLILTSDDAAHNIAVTDLVVTVDMPDRVESQRNLTSGTGTYTVTFPAAFHVTPSIGITANNMATGDYYVISSQSAAGFDIAFKNSGGSGVSRTFDYMAKGYGYSV